MKRVCFTILLTSNFVLRTLSQDINFSQFYELPLLRNPSLAGTYKGDVRVTTGYRSQWASVTTPYNTAALGTEMKFGLSNSNNYVSVGFQITHDQAGDSKLSRTQMFPMLTYHQSLNSEKDAYLSLGFLGGGVQQRFDPTDLKFSDQFINGAYSPLNPTQQTFQNTSRLYWDATVGLSYSSIVGEDTRFYAAIGYFHFTQPRVAFNPANDIRLNKKYVFNAGISGAVNDDDRIIFYGDYFMQGGNSQMQCGGMYQHTLYQTEGEVPQNISLSAGSFYRWNDAVVPVLKLTYNKLSAGLTYDVNISKLKPASHTRGGVELTLSYTSFFNNNNSSSSRVRCPVSLN